jgi:hypothetical protein
VIEWKILLPVNDNEGNSLAAERDGILGLIVKSYGGYTLGPVCEGAWVNDEGDIVIDEMQPVYVSMAAEDENHFVLRLEVMRKTLKQDALYAVRGGASLIMTDALMEEIMFDPFSGEAILRDERP